MNARHTERLVAFARRHETTADLALALGILLIANTDALAEQPHPLRLVLFNAAATLPLIWRRPRPMGRFAFDRAGRRCPVDRRREGARRCRAARRALHRRRARAPPARRSGDGACSASEPCSPRRAGDPTTPFKTIVGLLGLTIAAAGLGTSVRQRRSFQASLEERAASRRTRPDRPRDARHRRPQPLGDDRARRRRRFAAERAPERAARPWRSVSATGRQALAEMRRLLGVLREERATAACAPARHAGQIDALVGQVRAAGLPVELAVDGDAASPPGAQLAVYRLVQEALTNSLKHAGPAARAGSPPLRRRRGRRRGRATTAAAAPLAEPPAAAG